MYLIDTNICIYAIKNNPPNVINKLETFEPFHVKISSITVAELEYGVAKSINIDNNKKALIKFLSAFDIIPFNDMDAEIFGYLRYDLERRGKTIGPYDLQIASQAISRDLILVSNNEKEFNRIDRLKLENWV